MGARAQACGRAYLYNSGAGASGRGAARVANAGSARVEGARLLLRRHSRAARGMRPAATGRTRTRRAAWHAALPGGVRRRTPPTRRPGPPSVIVGTRQASLEFRSAGRTTDARPHQTRRPPVGRQRLTDTVM